MGDLHENAKMTSLDHIMEESDEKNTSAPDIYLWTRSLDYSKKMTECNKALDWYVIKGDGSTSKTKVLSPHLSRPPHDCNLSSHVVIGSTIYIIGGYVCDGTGHYNKTRAVYYIDTRYPERGWKEAAPMNTARICPSAFVVDGKIYVSGGCNYNRESYVEVYDPICNKWDNFPRMKDGRDLPGCVRWQMVISGEGEHNEKKVLLMGTHTSSLYLYDLVSGSCHAIITENLPGRHVKSSALLNGVLYCVGSMREGKIFAYDLEHLDSAPKSVIDMWSYTGFDCDFDQRRWTCLNTRMVSLGNGILAVLCPMNDNSRDTNDRKIGCFKFQMVKHRISSGELYVKANLLSSSSHFLDGGFDKCLIVFADPSPVADESEKYMLVNGGLKKRFSSACSSTATESTIDIHQLQELLKKTMAENEQQTEQRILQCMKSRFESMETRIIRRVLGAPSPQTADRSSSVKGQPKTNQPMQQSRSFSTGSGSTTNISDSNTRYSRRDLETDTKMTSLNQVMEDVDRKNTSSTPDILVCLGGKDHWYIIKNDDSTSQCAIPFTQLSQPPHDYRDSAHAVIGSTIYMAGGNYSLGDLDEFISGPIVLKTREVYYMDFRSPQPEWKEASPMKNERDRPYAFVVDGKIYVAGGFIYEDEGSMYGGCDNDLESYVEVYDPICDKWDNAPPMQYRHRLPKVISGHMVIGSEGDKEKKVLLVSPSSTTEIYLYDIESGSCQGIEMNQSYNNLVASMIIDGTLYCLERGSQANYLYAYDLDNLERDPKLVTGLEKYLPSHDTYSIHMVSLGDGKLAVLWPVKSHTERYSDTILLSCNKFQMVKGVNANGELTFEAHLLSCSTDSVEGYHMEKCLTAWTPSVVNLDDKSGENVERTSNNTNLFVNEIRGLMSDRDRDTEKVAIHTEKPQLSYQSNKSEVSSRIRDDNERNMHQLQEIIQAMSEHEQRTQHRIVQHIEACIESTESRILTEYLAGVTTSKKEASLGKGRGRGRSFRGRPSKS